MSNPIFKRPHVYKKGKILNLKPLDEGSGKSAKQYVFSSPHTSLKNIIESCNNLNQIVARNLLGIAKLLSYFGLSKDPSENHSKDPSVFNKFKQHFQRGGDDKLLEEIKILLIKQESKIKKLGQQVDKLKRPEDEKPINRDEVLDFTQQLRDIQEKLTQVIGQNETSRTLLKK